MMCDPNGAVIPLSQFIEGTEVFHFVLHDVDIGFTARPKRSVTIESYKAVSMLPDFALQCIQEVIPDNQILGALPAKGYALNRNR
jgi:hypothetical protein